MSRERELIEMINSVDYNGDNKVDLPEFLFPHAAKIESSEHNKVTETTLGTWIVPPSRPMRQDLEHTGTQSCL